MTLKLVFCTQDMVSDFIAKLTYLYGNLAVKHRVGRIYSAHVDDITYRFFSPSGARARIQGTCPER